MPSLYAESNADRVELCQNSALEAPVRAAAIEITFVFKLDLGRNLAM